MRKITQKGVVPLVWDYLEKQNMIPINIEYKKGHLIEVTTTQGIYTFQYEYEFKLIRITNP